MNNVFTRIPQGTIANLSIPEIYSRRINSYIETQESKPDQNPQSLPEQARTDLEKLAKSNKVSPSLAQKLYSSDEKVFAEISQTILDLIQSSLSNLDFLLSKCLNTDGESQDLGEIILNDARYDSKLRREAFSIQIPNSLILEKKGQLKGIDDKPNRIEFLIVNANNQSETTTKPKGKKQKLVETPTTNIKLQLRRIVHGNDSLTNRTAPYHSIMYIPDDKQIIHVERDQAGNKIKRNLTPTDYTIGS